MTEPGPLSHQKLGDRYLLGTLLGQGGFGAVYQARHLLLNRPQAIKILLEQHWTLPKFRERFIREAQVLATLDHPNIVHVDDFGIEGNRAYLVMPYIGGGTLQAVLKVQHGPLGLDVTWRYLEHICSALDYAHARNVAHLDLKPLNLLIHEDGRLLLSDFGLAHMMEQGAIEGGTSLQFGSPVYMAPEHFEGKPTQQSDLYALGVMLYQMLTGLPPFVASTPVALMRKHLTEPIPPLHLARPDLPVALDAVLKKALAKQQEQRYERAGELLFDVRAALGGQALQFASADEPTRLSQAVQETRIRATSLPEASAGQMLVGKESATTAPDGQLVFPQAPPLGFFGPGAPPLVSVPVAPPAASGKLKIWTQGFTRLFVLLGLVGGVVTVLVNLLLAHDQIASIEWISLSIQGMVISICLVGLRFVRSKLLRTGLLLQAGSLASFFVLFALVFHIEPPDAIDFLYSPVENYLPLFHITFLLTVLNASSLVIISYGIARGRRAQDVKFTALQVIVSSIFASLLLSQVYEGFYVRAWFSVTEYGGIPFIAEAVAFFAASAFLLRPACWKQHRVVTLLLGLGAVLFVFQAPAGQYFLIINWFGEIVGNSYVFSTTVVLSRLLLMFGFLLLFQTERVRKQPQLAEAASLLHDS